MFIYRVGRGNAYGTVTYGTVSKTGLKKHSYNKNKTMR
jgi:hypothetical protein